MDMKVNAAMAPVPVESSAPVNQSDGTFKFTLATHIQEADLQAKLNTLMEEITMQGDRLAKKRDIRDSIINLILQSFQKKTFKGTRFSAAKQASGIYIHRDGLHRNPF